MSMASQLGHVVYDGGATREKPGFVIVEDMGRMHKRRSNRGQVGAANREQTPNIIISGKARNIKGTNV